MKRELAYKENYKGYGLYVELEVVGNIYENSELLRLLMMREWRIRSESKRIN